MATVGVKSAIVGILGSDGKLIADEEKGLSETGLFEVNLQTSKGVTSANITGLSATITKIYGSNAVADSSVGIPAPQCVLGANDFPHVVEDKIVGMEIGEDGSATSYTSQLPSVPLIVETNAVRDGKSIYFAFFDNTVTRGDANLQTNDASEQRVADSMTFAANARASDGANYKIFYADAEGFDKEKMLAEVFPGYQAQTTGASTTSTTSSTTTTTTTQA